MKIATILSTAALGLAVVATPAFADAKFTQADRIQAGDENNAAIIFNNGGEFFTPEHLLRDKADRARDNS